MAGGFSVINLAGPFLGFLPEVEIPCRKVPLREKLIYTVISLFIFLVCSHLPLYGIHSITSNRGTVMDLRIRPIIASRIAMQLILATTKPIEVDEDRALLNRAHKLIGVVIAIGTAVWYVLNGMCGSVGQLGFQNVILIITQLSFASIIVTYLDELLVKYGLGYGVSLFIATNTCDNIIWKAFSPKTINIGREVQFEGAIVALLHLLITRRDKFSALKDAFFRKSLPNVTNLLAKFSIALVVVYLQGVRVFLPVESSKNARGQRHGYYSYRIKLLYTSNTPVILQSTLVSILYFISNFLTNLFGKLKEVEYSSGHLVPINGLAYYIIAPSSLAHMVADHFHAIFYLVFVLSTCAFFSKAWIEFSGSSADDVDEQLKER